MAAEPILYCLTRDRELATELDRRLSRALAFFYNDAARLYQAVMLRSPDVILLDTDAVRPEYGDAGLGPVVDFLGHRAAGARVVVRPHAGSEQLVAAEAGDGIELAPADRDGCVETVLRAFA